MQFEFEIIYELSEHYPIQKLCSIMDINRSSFYKWKKRLYVPNEKKVKRMENIQLFMNYHNKYATHGLIISFNVINTAFIMIKPIVLA